METRDRCRPPLAAFGFVVGRRSGVLAGLCLPIFVFFLNLSSPICGVVFVVLVRVKG